MPTTMEEKQLAQLRPSTTSTTTMLTASGSRYVITNIYMSVGGGATVRGTVYHDDDGTTFNNTTRILAETIASLGYARIPCHIAVADGGSIGVQSSTNSGVNFTLYGYEITE